MKIQPEKAWSRQKSKQSWIDHVQSTCWIFTCLFLTHHDRGTEIRHTYPRDIDSALVIVSTATDRQRQICISSRQDPEIGASPEAKKMPAGIVRDHTTIPTLKVLL